MNSKKFKRLLSVVLSMSMVLSFNMTSFASEADEYALGDAEKEYTAVTEGVESEGVLTEAAYENRSAANSVAEHEHDWEVTRTLVWADCSTESDGFGVWSCTVEGCSETKYDTIPFEHTWDNGTIEPATCVDDGKKVYHCTNHAVDVETGNAKTETCTATKVEVIPATGVHVYEDVITDATCTEEGYLASVCIYCGDVNGDKVKISDKLEHDWVETVLIAPECGKQGVSTFVCSICGSKETKVTDALEHVAGEGAEYEEIIEANCQSGAQRVIKCKLCGEAFKTEAVEGSQPIAHNYVPMPEVEATCETAGRTGGEWCYMCHAINPDNQPTVVPVDDTAHNYITTAVVREANCVQGGIERQVCEYCDNVYTSITDALGHKWNEGEITTAATCETAGVKTYTCQREGCTSGTNGAAATKEEEIAALGHLWVKGTTVAAKCETDGSTEYTCARYSDDPDKNLCDAASGDGTKTEVIPALGHEWDEGVIKDGDEPTCTTPGTKTYTCAHASEGLCDQVDGDSSANGTKTEEVPTVDHKLVQDGDVIQPTCTEPGKIKMVCEYSDCNAGENGGAYEEIVEVSALPALGHDLVVDEEKTTHATCTEDGVVVYNCSRVEDCGYVPTVEVEPATGHTPSTDPKDTETIAATCTEGAKKVTKCADCGEIAVTELIVDEGPTGHTPVAMKDVVADCHTQGSTGGTICAVCETVLVEPTLTDVDPTNHVYTTIDENGDEVDAEYEVIQAADCATQTNGLKKLECKYGDDTIYEAIPYEHDWEEDVQIAKGYIRVTCKECGAYQGDNYGYVYIAKGYALCDGCADNDGNPTVQKVTTTPAVEATCTTAGATAGATCATCNKEIEKAEEIPALGHNFTEEWTTVTPSTCTTPGVAKHKCTRCSEYEKDSDGNELTQELPLSETHNFVDNTIVDATCTSNTKLGSFCSDCGAQNPDVEPIELSGTMKDHSFVKGQDGTYACEYGCGTERIVVTTTGSQGKTDAGVDAVLFTANFKINDKNVEVVERGLVYTTSTAYPAGTELTLENVGGANLNGLGYAVRTQSTTDVYDSYFVRFDVGTDAAKARNIYARGYIVIKDGDETITIYSDSVYGSYNAPNGN